MDLSYWSKGSVERVYFNGSEGYVERIRPTAGRAANSFAKTVAPNLLAEVAAFVGNGNDETLFQNLKGHAANYRPEGLSAKSTKAKQSEQKARVAAFAKAFG